MPTFRTGKACGSHALKYPEFCYQPNAPILDFSVDCRDLPPTDAVVITLFLVANKRTAAKADKRVLQSMIRGPESCYAEQVDRMLHEAFALPCITHTPDFTENDLSLQVLDED